MRIPRYVFFFAALALLSCNTQKTAYYKMPKIDAHVHIRTENPEIVLEAKKENFKLLCVCTNKSDQAFVDKQMRIANKLQNQFPNDFFYITTFPMEGFEMPGWQDKIVSKLHQEFDSGAIGLKLWKDIGMVRRDSDGNFIMIDDPGFDKVLDFVASSNKTLMLHCGEPRDCWLPLDSMIGKQSKDYFKAHPEYYMYLHPECPDYDDQIAARDHLLAKHPNLRVVGAHLGSLEWSVDELAKRLDRYPNFAVDMAARICFLQAQDRQKVMDFIVKYQDRLIYGTDFIISEGDDTKRGAADLKKEWWQDWKYFSTDKEMTSYNVKASFKGLDLNDSILRKIYYLNAQHWFPGLPKL